MASRLPPIPGWIQCRLPDGSWGARYAPDTFREALIETLAEDLIGDPREKWIQAPETPVESLIGEWIEVKTRGGAFVYADIVKVVHRDDETLMVRYTPSPANTIY